MKHAASFMPELIALYGPRPDIFCYNCVDVLRIMAMQADADRLRDQMNKAIQRQARPAK